MKRLPAVSASLVLLSFFLFVGFDSRSSAQQQSPVAPNASGSVAAQEGSRPEARRDLQCQNCHATGGPLPYLGGALFHTDERANYQVSFHAKAAREGRNAATCFDCHTRGNDLTTMLPASDARLCGSHSTSARSIGRC